MELKNIVQQFLDINEKNIILKQLNNGLINDTFLVENTENQSQFILQKINTNVFKNPYHIVENHFIINNILTKNGYSKTIAKPIKTLNGNLLDETENQWRLQEFIPNCKTFLKVPNEDIAYESARLLSEFYFC
ncbi:MAG: aminoglycoside phosphotransferase family protein, partial [Cruoricaptor ignavus]|nr:aminoglycoside phosphotransferase family protein [Cruoricaptor ignavus]